MTTGVTVVGYEWADGYRNRIDVTVAANELLRIERRDKEIVPIAVVEESRNPMSPLHACFEWDDQKAGQLHREETARTLIRSVKVVYVRNDTEEPLRAIRAFVNVMDAPDDDPDGDMYTHANPRDAHAPATRHYRLITNIVSDQDLRARYVRSAFNALVSWRQRYRDIEEFAGIFEQIDALASR